MSQLFPHWKRTVLQFRITYWELSATHLCGWHRWVNCLEKIIETWSIIDKVDLRAMNVSALSPSSLVPFRINEQFGYGLGTHHCHHSPALSTPEGANKGKVVNLILRLPFSEKKCSEEHGTDGNFYSFRLLSSACFAEQKTQKHSEFSSKPIRWR